MGQVSIENTIMNMGSDFKVTSNNSNNREVKKTQGKFNKSLDQAKEASKSQTDNSSSDKENAIINKKDDTRNDKIKAKSKLEASKKNTTQDAKSESSSVKIDSLEDELVSDKGDMENQLLAMISEVLQIPIDELQSQLKEMEMTVQDLLSEEGFGKFVNQVLVQGDTNALLSSDIDIQRVSKLFDELKAFNEQLLSSQVKSEGQEEISNLIQKIFVGEELTGEELVGEEFAGQVNNSIQTEEIANQVEQTELGMQTLESREVKSENEMPRYEFKDEEEPELSFTSHENSEGNNLGINVPVHNFTTTTFTQSFTSEPGVITEATVTKQMVNGKSFIEQVDIKVLSQTKEINIALSPRELGNMSIKIVEQNGMMVAEIKVDNEKAKDFILNEIGELKNSLEDQGLNVADVKVDIRQDNHEAQMQQERQKSSKRIQEILASFDEEEEEMTEPLISSDSEVDYMV